MNGRHGSYSDYEFVSWMPARLVFRVDASGRVCVRPQEEKPGVQKKKTKQQQQQRTSVRPRAATPLRIGFVDLIDAAPLIVAHEQGFFADDGLAVVLERQLGWGN